LTLLHDGRQYKIDNGKDGLGGLIHGGGLARQTGKSLEKTKY